MNDELISVSIAGLGLTGERRRANITNAFQTSVGKINSAFFLVSRRRLAVSRFKFKETSIPTLLYVHRVVAFLLLLCFDEMPRGHMP